MINRAFAIALLAPVFVLLLALGSTASPGPTHAAPRAAALATPLAAAGSDDADDTTRPTVNEFYPEERPLGDCLSSLPKPDCGSEARGGWAQTVVFVAIVAGLAFIAWRIVAASRRARREQGSTVTPGTRDATTVPDGDGGDRAP